MVDPLKDDPFYRFAHALFMMHWWTGAICKGVWDFERAQAARNEAVGWASR